jgi:alpha-L-fucosidase
MTSMHRGIAATVLALLAFGCGQPGKPSAPAKPSKPLITKLGTIDCDMVETTPIVFKGKLYRFEYVRSAYYKPNTTGKSYFRFIDVASGQPTPSFAVGYDLGSAFVENDTVYVSCVNDWGGGEAWLFRSADLEQWESWKIYEHPDWKMYNTSLCRDDEGYTLAVELGGPPELVGIRFSIHFLRSRDLQRWMLTPRGCVYSEDRYSSCPTLHWLDGCYYLVYCEELPVPPGVDRDGWFEYAPYLIRSRDLVNWEQSPFNPVISFSDEDKKIANPNLTQEQRDHIAASLNLNNADMEFCEFQGKTVIYYCWGNQHGTEFLSEAVYGGTMESFLKGFFPER